MAEINFVNAERETLAQATLDDELFREDGMKPGDVREFNFRAEVLRQGMISHYAINSSFGTWTGQVVQGPRDARPNTLFLNRLDVAPGQCINVEWNCFSVKDEPDSDDTEFEILTEEESAVMSVEEGE